MDTWIHQRIRKEAANKARELAKASGMSDFDAMSVKELKDYCIEHGIDITGITKKDAIKQRITEVINITKKEEEKAVGTPTGKVTPPLGDGGEKEAGKDKGSASGEKEAGKDKGGATGEGENIESDTEGSA